MTTVTYFFGYAKIGSSRPDQKSPKKVRVGRETLNTHIFFLAWIFIIEYFEESYQMFKYDAIKFIVTKTWTN
jgi:hypothetical protein